MVDYRKYVEDWENNRFDEEEYKRLDKYHFALLKIARYSLPDFMQENEDSQLLNDVKYCLQKIHSEQSSIESEFK